MIGPNGRNGKLKNEFREFAQFSGTSVPATLSESILEKVQHDLNPPASAVFMKVALIQFLVGLGTLAFCPQFGFSLTSGMGLMHYLMRFGDAVCMLGCGALFTGTSLLVASLVLKPEEIKVLRKNRILHLTSVAGLSLGAFICVGAEVVATLGLVWILGALVGGSTLLQFGWTIRKAAIRANLLR